MSNIPSDLKYTRDHEWLRVKGDQGILGITDYAQRQLGEVVFAQLPNVGDQHSQGEPLGTIESVKAVAEFFAPVSGSIVEINEAVQADPEDINDDPYGDGWLVKIRMTNPKDANSLMSADEYTKYITEEG